jgi:type II secretory pathway pseudopilin PulG
MTTRILWLIYAALLGVLLPHTAWAFSRFEPDTPLGLTVAWTAAFAFEAAIAALTDRLAQHAAKTPRYTAGRVWLRKLAYQCVNVYAIGLFVALVISGLANFAHAVEFSRPLAVFGAYSLSPSLYSVAFGGILPVVSLLFAGVLSSVAGGGSDRNEEVDAAKQAERTAKQAERTAKQELAQVQRELEEANARFVTASDLFVRLVANEKRERILFARQQWPELAAGAIAIVTESSPSYVSEVLAGTGDQANDATS